MERDGQHAQAVKSVENNLPVDGSKSRLGQSERGERKMATHRGRTVGTYKGRKNDSSQYTA